MKNSMRNYEKIPFEYSKSFLENIVVNGPVGIIVTDYDFNIKYMNSIALDIHKTKENYNNLNLEDLIVKPEILDAIKNPLISETETNIRITYEILNRKAVITIRAIVNLARDENYYPIGGFLFICEDVTLIKNLREQAHENEKIETLKKMIVTYNHEMNSVLTVLMGRIELLLRKLPPDDKNIKSLKEISNSAKKLSEIVIKIRDIKKIKVKNYDKGTKMIDIDNQ